MQHCSGAATVVAITVGEGNSKDNYEGGIVSEEVSYEETDSLDGSSSTQETRKFFDLVVVSKVTKNLNYA